MSNSWTGVASWTSLKSKLSVLTNSGSIRSVAVTTANRLTSLTFVGVWPAGPVLRSTDRNLTEPVNGTRRILFNATELVVMVYAVDLNVKHTHN